MITTSYDIRPIYTKYATEDTTWEAQGEERTVEVYRTETVGDVTDDIAAGALDLLAAAYAHQFERRQAWMPEGTFVRYFDSTDGAKVAKQAQRMKDSIEGGSAYSLIINGDLEGFQVALAKVSPSRAGILQKAGLTSPNAYLNDIAVDPGRQGQKLASLALFDLIGEERFDRRRALVADGFAGADAANGWFWRLGMRDTRAQLEHMEFDETGIGLPQTRYSSEGIATLGDITDRLAHRLGMSAENDD